MAGRYSVTRCHGMILRSATRAKAFYWMSLPAEIRLMILEAITQQMHPGWASLASVCKEWQLVIEKRNFHRLKLRLSCLDDLERMIIRQRELVQHIWLDIELPEYSCRSCEKYESFSGSGRNRSIISSGIWKLFRILSAWKPAGGLTLELNAYSPSDSDHWFKNYYFSSDDEDDEDATSVQANDCSWHDPQHGWINGQQVKTPPEPAVQRLFGMHSLSFKQELPQVDRVTFFVIRRQLRRQLPPGSLVLILDKLCRLTPDLRAMAGVGQHAEGAKGSGYVSISLSGIPTYLPYLGRSYFAHLTANIWVAGFLQLVQKHLPQTVEKLSVFEDFSNNLIEALGNDLQAMFMGGMELESDRIVDRRIGAAFASRSLDLEQLSVSYMVNAEDFFQACEPTWTWQRLRSLALTTGLLRPAESRREVDALLYKAGITALRMPRLHTLVLWDGAEGNACAFIYHSGRDRAYLTWRSTWDMELSPRVVEVWQSVALERHPCVLRVSKQQVDGVIGSHGDAIYHLGLPCQVLAPASLWQIRREEVASRFSNI
ncbi:hypothetical protein ACJ41O_008628 [Fusarium nematophilum]